VSSGSAHEPVNLVMKVCSYRSQGTSESSEQVLDSEGPSVWCQFIRIC
jgi:hypothetical protein